MNWGKGIALFLIAFIIFISTLGYIMIKADAQLVSEDYYQKEVEYGTEISAETNALKSDAKLITSFKDDGLHIEVKNTNDIIELNIGLLRSNNSDLDLNIASDGNYIFIEQSKLVTGKYMLTALWKNTSKSYQIKKEIWVP